MKAVILNVGDEVLEGRVINTNSSFLSSSLLKVGIKTEKIVVVGDNERTLQNEINSFINSDCDLLITTGGLGPTHDDFTKELLAKTLDIEMILNKDAKELLDNYFKDKYADCNLKQAYFPKDSIIIPNKLGTADGAIIEKNNKIFIILVGPPFEMKPMFNDSVLPYLKRKAKVSILINEYVLMGICESEAEDMLKLLYEKYPNINIAPYASIGKIRYQITGAADETEMFIKACTDFQELFSEYIVTSTIFNKDLLEIEELVVNNLKKKKYHISFCESCTGGMLVSKIINVNGASDVINESLVTYSNEAKIKYLNVNKETIQKYGVVSEQVVYEMANGLYRLTGSEVCVSVSGIAGPTGGTANKPVGLVHFAIRIDNNTLCFHRVFRGGRDQIRTGATMFILYKINSLLK